MTINTEVPQMFDWVKAREKCTTHELYERLFHRVDVDCKSYEKINPERINFGKEQDRFWVSRKEKGIVIVFYRKEECITVTSKDAQENETTLFEVKPHLFDDVGCKFEIKNDKPLEAWQVSRRALEDLFFG